MLFVRACPERNPTGGGLNSYRDDRQANWLPESDSMQPTPVKTSPAAHHAISESEQSPTDGVYLTGACRISEPGPEHSCLEAYFGITFQGSRTRREKGTSLLADGILPMAACQPISLYSRYLHTVTDLSC